VVVLLATLSAAVAMDGPARAGTPAGATPTPTGDEAAPGPPGDAAVATPQLATSLLSPRRLPDWLASSVAHERLATAVSSVLTPAKLGTAADSTCALVSQGNQVLASIAPTTELIPASNMKLLTATAALDKLGPDFEYTTRVMADQAPAGGVLTGNLYLVGSGDPVLRTAPYVASLPYSEPDYTSFSQLAAQVVAAGITQITGSVIGDESLFDTQRAVPTWKSTYTSEGDVGPLSALDVNDGFVLTHGTYQAAPQPALSAAAQFAALLTADGVRIAGAPGVGATPASAVPVTSIDSPPLSEVIQTILRASDDTGAELVTKELGARFGGAGTTVAGVAVVRADLAADGLPVSELQSDDGSGLDRSDRATCQLILDDLQHEGASSTLAAGLPVAGRTGTLDDRLTAPATVGRILAKTGTLDDVSALSGFVLPHPGVAPPAPALGSPLVFSLIIDGLANPDAGVTVGDDLATVLAAYPSVPAASTLGPR
jgi:serine-type D-Ala-D-Ala carboxypeptidase/endopeptidase (penicillin-binding protein 4)